jgi:ubiquinone/menaquinone biosynthesis C-methylase UbiE
VTELERWERAAAGWDEHADEVRGFGMPVSAWLIDRLTLQPGQTVLELAAGPGDTGFLAAELVRPGGKLISSDGAEAMLDIARRRAREAGLENVEFKRLELEWIDLPAASVDAVVCRWGVMLSADPGSCLQEMRRVVRPGGHIALAVWDAPNHNPWASLPRRALVELGLTEPADPAGPGMFALGDAGRLRELFESAGFVEVIIETVDVIRPEPSVERFIAGTLELSLLFKEAFERLSDSERDAVQRKIASLAEPFTAPDGSLALPGRSLVAAAGS